VLANSRFYAPGPNSHFFTGSAGDVAILDRPGTGWIFENIAFYTGMPDAGGNCSQGLTPVRRLYNNRAAQNDSNHRFTADEVARQIMVARGWVDEGVAFCAYGKRIAVVETHSFALFRPADVMQSRSAGAQRGWKLPGFRQPSFALETLSLLRRSCASAMSSIARPA
jgi:hypothetical protein